MDLIFRALADPRRRSIVSLLKHQELSVGEIVEQSGLPQPEVSKHLKLLATAGVLGRRKAHRFRFYHLHPEALRSVDSWLDEYRDLWTHNLVMLKAHLERDDDEREAP